MKKIVFTLAFVLTAFVVFSKPIYADGSGLRNPALLIVSVPVVATLIGVLVTSLFSKDEPQSEIESKKLSELRLPEHEMRLQEIREMQAQQMQVRQRRATVAEVGSQGFPP